VHKTLQSQTAPGNTSCICSAPQQTTSSAKSEAKKAAAVTPAAASKASGTARKVPDLPPSKAEPAAAKPATAKKVQWCRMQQRQPACCHENQWLALCTQQAVLYFKTSEFIYLRVCIVQTLYCIINAVCMLTASSTISCSQHHKPKLFLHCVCLLAMAIPRRLKNQHKGLHSMSASVLHVASAPWNYCCLPEVLH